MKAAALALCVLFCGCAAGQAPDDTDPAVRARIETQLRGRVDIDMRYVTVDVTAGAATVSGIVPTFEQKTLIRKIAGKTRGVETVLDNIVVQE